MQLVCEFFQIVTNLQKCFSVLFIYLLIYLFWPHPWQVEVPGPGIEPVPLQNQSHCSDSAGSLTAAPQGNSSAFIPKEKEKK